MSTPVALAPSPAITDVLPLVCLAVLRSLALALQDVIVVVASKSVFVV